MSLPYIKYIKYNAKILTNYFRWLKCLLIQKNGTILECIDYAEMKCITGNLHLNEVILKASIIVMGNFAVPCGKIS